MAELNPQPLPPGVLLNRFLAETKASAGPQEHDAAFTAWLNDNPVHLSD